MKKNALLLYEYMPPYITGAYNRGLFLYNFFKKHFENYMIISSKHDNIPQKDVIFLNEVRYFNKGSLNKFLDKLKKIIFFGNIKGFIDKNWIQSTFEFLKDNEKFVPDIVYASYPGFNAVYLALLLKKLYPKSTYILELRDPLESYMSYDINFLKTLKFLILNNSTKKIEKNILDKFDKIIAVSDYEKSKIMKLYKVKNVYTVKSGYYKIDETFDNKSNDDKSKLLHIGHFGSFSKSDVSRKINKLGYFFDFLERSKYKNLIQFNFYGRLTQKEIEFLNKYSFTKYHGVIKEDLIRYMIKEDVLFIYNNNKYKGILTGKLFEYMAANKPILAYSEYYTEFLDIINSTGGVVVNRRNINYELIEKIIELKKKEIKYNNYLWEKREEELKSILFGGKK